jgi:S1-C subfamily serine protease
MKSLVLFLILFAIALGGCSHGMDIRYDSATNQLPKILSPEGTNIYLAPIEDTRINRASKDLNTGFRGSVHTYAPIESPVDITRNALTEKLRKYGINILDSNEKAHGVLKGVLKDFSFADEGFGGEAVVSLDLELANSGGTDVLWNQNLHENVPIEELLHESMVTSGSAPARGLSEALTKAINNLDSFPSFLITVSALFSNPNLDIRQLQQRADFVAEKKRQQQAQAEKEPPPSPPKKQTPQSGTGSGFFVSKLGHVITNAHVVKGCKKLTVGDNANKQVPAELINTDSSNDLALLKLSTLEMASAESKSLIQKLSIAVVPLASKGLLRSEDVRLGEKILVAGYPFGDAFSSSIKVTTGVVSSTRGVGDDSGQFQLDAAVQPGNSGGPIYDSGGNIVGVVISQLNKKTFGGLVENVNFGIKASTVRQFLVSSGLSSKKAEQTDEKSTEQLAEIAQNQALMVMCLQ